MTERADSSDAKTPRGTADYCAAACLCNLSRSGVVVLGIQDELNVERVTGMDFSADSRLLALTGWGGNVVLYSRRSPDACNAKVPRLCMRADFERVT